jgi:hypothetical protein
VFHRGDIALFLAFVPSCVSVGLVPYVGFFQPRQYNGLRLGPAGRIHTWAGVEL